MPRRFRRAAASTMRCKRGVYALEFAWVALALLLLIFGAFEMVWHGLTSVALENALLQSTRTASLGCRQQNGTRAGQAGRNQILAAARAAGGASSSGNVGLLGGNTLDVAPYAWGTLAAANADAASREAAAKANPATNANTAQRTGGTAGTGVGGQIVEYRLTYDPPLLFLAGWLNRSSYAHSGIVTIKNEPFISGGAGAQPCS